MAACSDPGVPEAPPEVQTDAVKADVILGGVDLNAPLRVLGTEPFWGVDISRAGLVYSGLDRPEQRADNGGPTVQGTTADWSATTDQGAALRITLIDTDCSDGMSDRTYPLTARVVIGQETLNGCAAPADFVMNTDERGDSKG